MSDALLSPRPTNRSLTGLTLRICVVGLALGAGLAAQAQQQTAQPPIGMVMGAYGQSLQLQQPAQAPPAPTTTAGQPPVLAATAADPVSRFMLERGVLAQAAQERNGGKLLEQVRDSASDMVLAAMNFLGVRYTRGGSTVESGFDCSGFTRHIFERSVGLVLPRRADEQAKLSSLLTIKRDELKPGDLVFFNTMRRTFSHVGIYVGEGKFIHAPRTGAAVRVEDMREAYWAKRFTGARRADVANKAAVAELGGTLNR
jgi:cell wall-associated NlpC family hydrolase